MVTKLPGAGKSPASLHMTRRGPLLTGSVRVAGCGEGILAFVLCGEARIV